MRPSTHAAPGGWRCTGTIHNDNKRPGGQPCGLVGAPADTRRVGGALHCIDSSAASEDASRPAEPPPDRICLSLLFAQRHGAAAGRSPADGGLAMVCREVGQPGRHHEALPRRERLCQGPRRRERLPRRDARQHPRQPRHRALSGPPVRCRARPHALPGPPAQARPPGSLRGRDGAAHCHREQGPRHGEVPGPVGRRRPRPRLRPLLPAGAALLLRRVPSELRRVAGADRDGEVPEAPRRPHLGRRLERQHGPPHVRLPQPARDVRVPPELHGQRRGHPKQRCVGSRGCSAIPALLRSTLANAAPVVSPRRRPHPAGPGGGLGPGGHVPAHLRAQAEAAVELRARGGVLRPTGRRRLGQH